MKLLVAAWLALLAGARSQETSGARSQVDAGTQEEWAGLRVVMAAYRQCRHGQQPLLVCLQLRALKAADRALRADRVSLLDGVELVRNSEARTLQQAPALDDHVLQKDPSRLTTLLLDRLSRFLHSHSVNIDQRIFITDEDALEEGRGKKKKKYKKLGGLLLLAGALKAGLMALAAKGVAVLTVAALVTGTVALVLASIVGFGTLLGSQHGHTTYEIVKHPHVSHVKSHSSSHEYVEGHEDEEYGGDWYESRVGAGPVVFGAATPARLTPDLRAHPLVYRRQPGALSATS